MANFSKLKKLELTSVSTATYRFSNIDGAPQITVKPATEINKPYFNALLKRARRNTKVTVSASLIADSRNEDRELYAQHIISDWANMEQITDDITFNLQNCKDFLEALPDYEFDSLREFCSNPMNFIEGDSIDADKTAKN